MRDQPLSEAGNTLTREMFNVRPICSKTLRKYIISLVRLVEEVIKESLPKHFGIMFDGWTETKIQYVAVFAT